MNESNDRPTDGTETGQYRPDLQEAPAQELVLAPMVSHIGQVSATAVPVTVQPTQVRRPWRSTVRTLFQAGLALVTLLPFVISGVYDTEADYPAVVVQVLGVTSAVARVMALPQVEAFLRRFLPFLSAAPNPK